MAKTNKKMEIFLKNIKFETKMRMIFEILNLLLGDK